MKPGETQLSVAREGRVTPEMETVALDEGLDTEALRGLIAAGRVVIPRNRVRPGVRALGVGQGLRVKVNANLGTSPDESGPELELAKLAACVEAGADTVMDLSTGGDLPAIRREIMAHTDLPLGTVPIYQAAVQAARESGGIIHLTVDSLFAAIAAQAAEGVDFMTVHSGLNRAALERLRTQGRVGGIVSRGGAFLATWMVYHDQENPFYEFYDRLLDLAREYDVTLSLGDGLRPGCLADATDRAQVEELIVLGELARRAREAGVQVMIEGPGHVPLDQVETNIKLQKSLCEGAPFYVLGPLVTDVAAGYDHIACAIGGALAGMHGADFLCYVTPAEHLKLPNVAEVREGVIASKIAAHAADLARRRPEAWARDLAMSQARQKTDWEGMFRYCLDPVRARELRQSSPSSAEDVCTMCGEFCAVKLVREYLTKG
jgi:phosphomethylpyrimidine synthase